MNDHVPYVSQYTMETVSGGLESLMGKKARFGLPAPVKRYEIAHDGTCWHGKKIHFWVMLCGYKIGLRIFEHPSRPKRSVLQDLISKDEPPTLIVYNHMTPARIMHKLAQCIKTGLSRVRSGLIGILKPRRDRGLIHRCDSGSVFSHTFNSGVRQC